MNRKYDWKKIQEFYNDGNSWKDVIEKYGMSSQTIANAISRGEMKTRTLSESSKLSFIKHGPRKMGMVARKKLSIEQSIRNRGGKSKWYTVSGQLVQGTWERNLAIKFDELGIAWKKLSTGKDAWPYVIDGKLKHYTPDFYLTKYDLYLDPKGYWWGDDKRKIEEVHHQHPNKKLIIIEKDDYKKLLSGNISILLD